MRFVSKWIVLATICLNFSGETSASETASNKRNLNSKLFCDDPSSFFQEYKNEFYYQFDVPKPRTNTALIPFSSGGSSVQAKPSDKITNSLEFGNGMLEEAKALCAQNALAIGKVIYDLQNLCVKKCDAPQNWEKRCKPKCMLVTDSLMFKIELVYKAVRALEKQGKICEPSATEHSENLYINP